MFEWISPTLNLLGIAVILISGVWWFQSQFSHIKSYFFSELEKLQINVLNKIEYHERHDDKRFADLRDDVWEIRLRNAAIDGRRFSNVRIRDDFSGKEDSKNTDTE